MSDLVPGVARAISPMVRRILAPNPGVFTGPGTNTYLIGIDEVVEKFGVTIVGFTDLPFTENDL